MIRSLAASSLVLSCVALGCSAETAATSASAADLSRTSIGGTYHASPATQSFVRDDGRQVWDFFDLTVTRLAGDDCTYEAKVVDIDCGSGCSADDMEDPANRSAFEGACKVDEGKQTLTLLSLHGSEYGHDDVVYRYAQEGGELRLSLLTGSGDHAQALVRTGSAPAPAARDHVFVAGAAYAMRGEDNNYVATFEVQPGWHTSAQPTLVRKELFSASELEGALAECVFMRSGAYGEHIEAATQSELAANLAKGLLDVRTPTMKFFHETGISSFVGNVFEAPCTFAVVDGGYLLRVESASHD